MNKRIVSPIILLVCFFLLATACDSNTIEGNGNVTTKTIEVESFDKLNIKGGYTISLVKGTTPSVQITTDENLFQYIEAETSRNTLQLATKEEIKGSKGTKIIVTYTEDLEKIEISGAAKLNSEDPIRSRDLEVEVEGAGIVDLEIYVKELKLTLSGAGTVTLAGEADEQDLSLSGAGNLSAYDLICRRCEVNLSGVGNAEVHVTDALDATISGMGTITYKGEPEKINQSINGAGSIKRYND